MKSIIKNPMKWLTISLVVISFQTITMAEGDNDKVGSSAFKFLNIQTDAHGAALGGLAAQASGANALFWNPAGIAGSEGIGVSAGMTQWLVETTVMNAGVVMPMMGGTIGLSLVSVDYGEIMKSGWAGTSEFVFEPNQGSFTPTDMSLQASYGRSLSDKFSLGATAKMISQNIDDVSISGLAFDIGTQFNTGYRGISMGAVISNFGPDVVSQAPEEASYEEFPGMSLPMTFSFGVVGEAIPGLNAGLNVLKQADMAQEFIFNGEYSVAGLASLRFSYNISNPQQPMSFGAGLGMAGITANVAFSTTLHFDPVMRFGIGYAL
ncbi:MAG: PorV/PorQ family protein [Candidatus Marinimicrobia bacterium]|nr:PorV/PorQ family protein [Candidatus Neomarinimicrobiota bacterium]MBT4371095.1 PorV/PorQ family protein [Candidatus Neomarinimicrobiota bacterium]MBT6711987.1 PorV/PorQ family protein [Candidatus Neomarinimicrobiota bacterium]